MGGLGGGFTRGEVQVGTDDEDHFIGGGGVGGESGEGL